MDSTLHATFLRHPTLSRHAVLLPTARDGNVSKLNVIGERQRYGRSVLERGLNVVHSDADALWLRDPFPLFANADIVAERIWGKPLSVVKAWGCLHGTRPPEDGCSHA